MWKPCLRTLAAVAILLSPVAALAEEPASRQLAEPDWQAVITAQIESLRDGDAESALMLSTTAFQVSYHSEPQLFVDAIVTAGYRPIIDSRMHSFGEFARRGARDAAQVVRFVGKDWLVYNVIYELVEEPDGWRIRNVLFISQDGVFI